MSQLKFANAFAKRTMQLIVVSFVVLFAWLMLLLANHSGLILKDQNFFQLLKSSTWKPSHDQFGLFPFVMSTITITALGVLIAVPLCFFTTIYLAFYAPNALRRIYLPLLELLAGIPPIIFGVWGTLAVVPFVQWTGVALGHPETNGFSILAGAIVLALMLAPLLISLMLEVVQAIPLGYLHAALSVGASPWQVVKAVVLPKTFPGFLAATVLAISRALGETIAVLMVCGNVVRTPHSVFDACYPITALIANNYGEMLSVPKCGSALMLAALVLVIIIIIFNVLARIVLLKIEKSLNK